MNRIQSAAPALPTHDQIRVQRRDHVLPCEDDLVLEVGHGVGVADRDVQPREVVGLIVQRRPRDGIENGQPAVTEALPVTDHPDVIPTIRVDISQGDGIPRPTVAVVPDLRPARAVSAPIPHGQMLADPTRVIRVGQDDLIPAIGVDIARSHQLPHIGRSATVEDDLGLSLLDDRIEDLGRGPAQRDDLIIAITVEIPRRHRGPPAIRGLPDHRLLSGRHVRIMHFDPPRGVQIDDLLIYGWGCSDGGDP